MKFRDVVRTIRTKSWCLVLVCVFVLIMETSALNGPNVCMVKQKYNITKRVKYRAPMWVRTYEWCFSMPPRCSKWNTEMRDLTRLETEERTAEVAVCCPGYKMKEVTCVPICPNGKTGPGCSEDCPDNKWGPNCVNDCKRCKNGFCSPITGECECLDGWQGESCDTSMPPTTPTPSLEEILTTLTRTEMNTPKITTPTTPPSTAKTTVSTLGTTVIIPKVATNPAVTSSKTPATVSTPSSTLTSPLSKTTTVSVPVPPILNNPPLTSTSTLRTLTVTTSNKTEEIIPIATSTEGYESTEIYNNRNYYTTNAYKHTTEIEKHRNFTKPINTVKEEATESPKIIEPPSVIKSLSSTEEQKRLEVSTTGTPKILTTPIITTIKTEPTRKETTVKISPTTIKFKPKEIWIKPAQKGESPIIETKIKNTHESLKHKSANNKETTPPVTTPKTIIVSIIPTSVSYYTTFKKIALTTLQTTLQNITSNTASMIHNKTELGITKPMTMTSTPSTKIVKSLKSDSKPTRPLILNSSVVTPSTSVTSKLFSTKPITSVTIPLESTKTIPYVGRTNSMKTDINKNSSTSITVSSNTVRTALKQNVPFTNPTTRSIKSPVQSSTERTTTHILLRKSTTLKMSTNATEEKLHKTTNPPKNVEQGFVKTNDTKLLTKVTATDGPPDDEEFHILTEPEHITAVMGDKGTDRSSVDLISVISIAGGVMMAVITVAVIIVMIERCRKPRYDDVRKVNDIRMQVMIDNNDGPPPYVRSIFHTPLPDPPSSEKCHYQPISTLDRNLKQFMRPVVVQTISPIMLENFRGILECHYDHLPRRSHDFEIQSRSSVVPPMNETNELRQLRASVTEAAIEALKCEAKLDVIDSTTSEPLYAEIPCWRPASEHAVEVMNMNGEAVTEL